MIDGDECKRDFEAWWEANYSDKPYTHEERMAARIAWLSAVSKYKNLR